MSGFLHGGYVVINYIIDMGASVMLPIIIAILSIIIGVKVGKAIRAGLMIGVGFVGMGLIVDMMNANMGPAAQAMADRIPGVSLSVVEVGWPGMSGTTWGSIIATIAIPVAILVNLIMFATKTTKTINIDIWNVWHMAFTGAIAYAITGNLVIGIVGVVFHAIIAYKLGDLWAPLLNDYFGLEGLTAPHGTSAYMAPVACFVDAIIDKIPGVRKINFSIEGLQEKVGVLGEPVVIGGLLGAIIGCLAYVTPGNIAGGLQQALPLGIKMAAVMVLMPRMIKCIMDGLLPISERAKELMQKYAGDNANFYIGLDPAVLLGDPEVVTAGIIFIPVTLLIAVIMSLVCGNQILPFGDLATIGFFIAIAVAVHKGNLFRTLISGSCIMTMTIWICNAVIPWTTKLGMDAGVVDAGELYAAMDQGGSPLTYIYTQIAQFINGQNYEGTRSLMGLIVIAVIYIICMVFSVSHSRKRQAELDAAAAEE